ncbi:hypothetical protein ACHQM5_018767 [Ranunculus cassubicifolius]
MADSDSEREKLPPELVVDILSRLPAPYLWPLRCVSKSWFRLIAKDPQFAKSIHDRSVQFKSNPSFVIAWGKKKSCTSEDDNEKLDFYMATDHTQCDKAVQLKLPFLSDEQNPRRYPVYGICNGMLCLSDDDKHEVYIWNPLTNDHIAIPYPTTPLKSAENLKTNKSPKSCQTTIFGFAFLPSVNEYKIIKLVSEFYMGKLEYHTELSVYTLGKDSSWRTVAADVPYGVDFTNVPCPHNNGYVYWLARSDGEWPIGSVLAFELTDELLYYVIDSFDCPPISGRSDMKGIQELGGSLCLFNAKNKKDVDIWTLELNGESFSFSCTKLCTIGRPEVVGDFTVLVPLGIVACSGDILVLKNSMGFITYNTSTKSINHLKGFCSPIVNAHAFFGSIISPRVINEGGHLKMEREL